MMTSKTSPWAILGILFCTVFASSAQLFWKLGANRLEFSLMGLITNWEIILGVALYSISLLFMLAALKFGELSVLYPILAFNYIWVSILSLQILGELMSAVNWMGVVAIITGVALIGWGGSK